VDSTVVRGEFIDELADYLGVGERVQQVTKNAMGGSMNFRTALRERLNIMKPNRRAVEEFTQCNDLQLTPGIEELIKTLHKKGVDVYLVSGGFERLIKPLARQLNIPEGNIFANRLLFHPTSGEYSGFDETEPTSMSGGKALAVSAIKERGQHEVVFMVGDGATDAEACPPANAFIGFGGNVTREAVKQKCHLYTYNFQELISILRQNQPTSFASNSPSNHQITASLSCSPPSNDLLTQIYEGRTASLKMK